MQNFVFVGNPVISEKKDKKDRPIFNPVYTKEDSAWDTGKVKFVVKQGKNNSAFVEIGGGMPIGEKLEKKYPITTFDSDFNRIEIQWKDRFDEKTVENVSFSKQWKTNITGETEVFITEYDMRKFLSENLPKVDKNRLIKVTGQMKTNEYNGKFSQQFHVQNVWLLDEDTDEKPIAQVEIDLCYHNSGVEERDDEKVLDVVAYYEDYFGKDDGNMYVPLKGLSFNGTKLDMENPKHKMLWDSRASLLEPDTDNFVKLRWLVKYVNGAEEVEFTEDMLTPIQKIEIEMGTATLEDFTPSSSYGNNKVEFRLVRPTLKKVGKLNYSDGYIDTELTEEEFSIKIRRAVETEESIDDMEKTVDTKPEAPEETDDEDLF